MPSYFATSHEDFAVVKADSAEEAKETLEENGEDHMIIVDTMTVEEFTEWIDKGEVGHL